MHGPNAEKKEKPERATGLGGITREQIEKWNRMTDLRFQTEGVGGGHQKRPASLRAVIKSES